MDETYYKIVKWFGLGFLIWVVISGIVLVLYALLGYDWLGIYINVSAPIMNLFSILFCVYAWNQYCKTSNKLEKEYNDELDYLNSLREKIEGNESSLPPLTSPSPCTFKSRKREIGFLYAFAIILNLSILTYNLITFI